MKITSTIIWWVAVFLVVMQVRAAFDAGMQCAAAYIMTTEAERDLLKVLTRSMQQNADIDRSDSL